METTVSDEPLSPLESFIISLGFWTFLFIACGMYSVLALSPKLLEQAKLERQAAEMSQNIATIESEIIHLDRLSHALQQDEEFRERLRNAEFSIQRSGTSQIKVADNLEYDARVPTKNVAKSQLQQFWYEPPLQELNSNSRLRFRWLAGMICSFLIAFLFMNEQFFTGHLGHWLLRHFGNLFQRYRVPSANLDEEGCQLSS